MSGTQPQTDLDPRYGSPGATATPWPEALARLSAAELYWLSTVRPDGRPHVTPLLDVWQDGALQGVWGVPQKTQHDRRAGAEGVQSRR
jgi:hypothetical protein